MASKLKIVGNKRLPTKHFMSTTIAAASKAAVPKKKILAQRNQTPDVEEQPRLSRSLSFDSKASKVPVDVHDDDQNNLSVDSPLPPYDPINNYLSPRPRFLRYDPNRHRRIFDCQENVTGVRRSSSFDAGMLFSGEELESCPDNSPAACSQKEPLEEVEKIIGKDVGQDEDEEDEYEYEYEDNFEEDSGWSSNVFLKYLLVMIVLILTTLAISSMNSPNLSPLREAARGLMDWYSKPHSSIRGAVGLNFSEAGGKAFDPIMQTDLVVGKPNKRKIDYVYDNRDKKTQDEVGSKEGGSDQLEGLETDQDEMWSKEDDTEQLQGSETAESKEVEIDETGNREECSYPSQEPIIAIDEERERHEIEAEEEPCDQLFRADFNQNDVIEGSESVKKMVEEDVSGKEDGDKNELDERLDQMYATSIGVAMLILGSFSVLYCSKQMKASPPVQSMASHSKSTEIKKLEAFTYPSSSMLITQDKHIMNPTSLMLHPVEKEASKGSRYINPPDVELLSEFVIGGGDATSSSPRSCGTKDSNMLAETEETSSSLSHGTKYASLMLADAASSSRTRSSSSPSYGSFTAEKMIVKKQRSKKAEVVPSPVRRSSRIQNRSVMSP